MHWYLVIVYWPEHMIEKPTLLLEESRGKIVDMVMLHISKEGSGVEYQSITVKKHKSGFGFHPNIKDDMFGESCSSRHALFWKLNTQDPRS